MPFTDEVIQRIRVACSKPPRPAPFKNAPTLTSTDYVGAEWRNSQGVGSWTGEDLLDLTELMLHTGFRICDATLFDMGLLQGNKVMIRAQKNGNYVFAWVPDSVRDRLIERAKLHGARPFILQSERLETVTNVWRRRLAKAFDAAGKLTSADTAPLPSHVRPHSAGEGCPRCRRRRPDGRRREDGADAPCSVGHVASGPADCHSKRRVQR